MTASGYKTANERLMADWRDELCAWIGTNATFYEDGVIDPEVWFRPDNVVRPLFVLKEPNEETTEICERLNFVEPGNPKSDPWRGKGMWGRLGALAVAIFHLSETLKGTMPELFGEIPNYDYCKKYMEELQPNGESRRQNALRKAAVVNLKKVGGGSSAESNKSKELGHFILHAKRFADKLEVQIRTMEPTLIVCCGVGVAEQLGMKDGRIYGIPAVSTGHPSRCGTDVFYYKTLDEIIERQLMRR